MDVKILEDGKDGSFLEVDWNSLEKYDKSTRKLARQKRLQSRYEAAR